MPENVNPLVTALRVVFGPLVKQSSKWPPLLAYGLPGIVAVMLIVLLRPVVPDNLIWLVAIVILLAFSWATLLPILMRRRSPYPSIEGNISKRPELLLMSPAQIKRLEELSIAAVLPLVSRLTYIFGWPSKLGALYGLRKGEVHVDKENRWIATVFEDGAIKRFSSGTLNRKS